MVRIMNSVGLKSTNVVNREVFPTMFLLLIAMVGESYGMNSVRAITLGDEYQLLCIVPGV